MRANEGSVDRYLRFALGLVLVALGLMLGGTGTLPIILYVLSAVMFITSITGFCPLYTLLGMNTCKR